MWCVRASRKARFRPASRAPRFQPGAALLGAAPDSGPGLRLLGLRWHSMVLLLPVAWAMPRVDPPRHCTRFDLSQIAPGRVVLR